MAKIMVEGDFGTVTLSEPDEDGDYSWTCSCGLHKASEYRPLDEAISSAEMHVDYGTPG